MSAGPQYGMIRFVGLRTRVSYIKDVYFSDVNNELVKWDAGAGAAVASPSDWTPPEPVVMRDVSVAAALTDCTKLQLTRNGVATGDMLRAALHLVTVTVRPQLNIPFAALGKIQIIQKT